MALLQRVAQAEYLPPWQTLDADRLQEMTRDQGVDVATATMYLSLRRDQKHRPWIDVLEQRPDASSVGERPLIGIVPGGCYQENTDSCQSLRLVRDEVARRGFPVSIVPVASFGRIDHGADVVLQWLSDRVERSVILVSLSKGGAEVKLALREQPAAFRAVTAWVDVSGLLYGSQWISWLLGRVISRWGARCWARYWGYSYESLVQLQRGPHGLLDFDFTLPDHLQLIHIYGFPLSGRLTHPYTRRSFRRLSPYGPNDGMGVMLGDLTRMPGHILPVWDADHFLRSSQWTMRELVGYALDVLAKR